jgi:hypothetical protein
MTYPNVRDLLVPEALSSPNIWSHMIEPPGLMIKIFFGASLKQCILLPQFGNLLLFLGLCHCIWIISGQSWFYLYALHKCLWLFNFCPTVIWNILMCFLLWLMCFWEYLINNAIGPIVIVRTCSSDGSLLNNLGNVWIIFPN